MDTPGLSVRELDALFDQSPVAMVFSDREMRVLRANAAFRQLTGLPGEALIGRRPSEFGMADRVMDLDLIERTLAGQVMSAGVPVVSMPLEQVLAGSGERRVFSWTAYRVTDNGRVLGAAGFLVDITASVTAAAALQEANARLDLLQRAGSEIGITLDIHRTAAELTALAVPGFADRAIVDLLDPVLGEEDPLSAAPDALRLRRVAVRDAATEAVVDFAVGDLITVPVARRQAAMFLRREPLLARNRTGMRQSGLPAGHVQALLDRGIHTFVRVPLTARGVTLGSAGFGWAEHPGPYEEADVRLFRDLAARAAVHIDNARLYTREHDAAVTLQRSMLPRDIPPVAGLDIAYRYRPASEAAEIGGDWFDVIPLDRGQIALVVGDVTGHGIHAAATMGQLRTATAALARLGCPSARSCNSSAAWSPATARKPAPPACTRFTTRGRAAAGWPAQGIPRPRCAAPAAPPNSSTCPLACCSERAQAATWPSTGSSRRAARWPCTPTGSSSSPGRTSAQACPGSPALAAGPGQSPDDLCDSVLATLAPRPRDDIALLLARTTTTP